MKPWLSVPEAAVVVGRDKRNIWRWIEKGRLRPQEGSDGTMRVSSDELLRVESTMRRGRPRGSVSKR